MTVFQAQITGLRRKGTEKKDIVRTSSINHYPEQAQRWIPDPWLYSLYIIQQPEKREVTSASLGPDAATDNTEFSGTPGGDMVGFTVAPEISLVDEPVKIQAWGLLPDQVNHSKSMAGG
ncbi:unnamed protein product [Ranitomeya imitator]|uniref:Uncharacterized protein n=1 Tax=Ranitomeya imitator TaxID=111125 RepID=A0ABN9LZN2_9NEOB|nr:unnamed protein product [Ranitomeya imitator]